MNCGSKSALIIFTYIPRDVKFTRIFQSNELGWSLMSDSPCVLIAEARFYPDISDSLAKGAINVLNSAGFDHVRLEVPGVFELPAAITMALQGEKASRYEGVIAFGCVIKGETDHYDHICRESSRALMDLSTHHVIALGFGILTCENQSQAQVRSAIDGKNKGAEAAKACLQMIKIKNNSRPNVQ